MRVFRDIPHLLLLLSLFVSAVTYGGIERLFIMSPIANSRLMLNFKNNIRIVTIVTRLFLTTFPSLVMPAFKLAADVLWNEEKKIPMRVILDHYR